jgi:uncharacterized membrane protein
LNPYLVLLLAFLIGIVSGLRSFTAPAVLSWAACRNWINIHNTLLFFMGAKVAVVLLTLLAVVELVLDKLPSTPSRTKPPGLIARVVLGGLSGAGIALAGAQPVWAGAALGSAGGITGAFAGYQVRTRLVSALKVPDLLIALFEDAVAICGGLLIVSRF